MCYVYNQWYDISWATLYVANKISTNFGPSQIFGQQRYIQICILNDQVMVSFIYERV